MKGNITVFQLVYKEMVKCYRFTTFNEEVDLGNDHECQHYQKQKENAKGTSRHYEPPDEKILHIYEVVLPKN